MGSDEAEPEWALTSPIYHLRKTSAAALILPFSIMFVLLNDLYCIPDEV